MTKFKVGDVIYFIENPEEKKEVIAIIYERQTFKGNWKGSSKPEQIALLESYVIKNLRTNFLTYFRFIDEDSYELFSPSTLNTNSCPRCSSPLIKKISEYTNTTILKCPNCKWC